MKISNFEKLAKPSGRLKIGLGKIGMGVALGLAVSVANSAVQTTIAPNAVTAPKNGFVATGSSGARHLWISDHLQGLCRVDPALDSAGPYSVNANTCTIGGPAVFNPQTNHIYVVDEVANNTNQGLLRHVFNPLGDGGHGSLGAATRLGTGSSNSCGISGNRPSGMALGPDGNLYLSFLKSGNIVRVVNPSATNTPCSNFRNITSVGRRNEGVAFVGHNLYGLGDASPWKITNADTCPVGNCPAEDVFTDDVILPNGIGSNQQGQNPNGTALFIADLVGSVTKIENPNNTPNVIADWAIGFSNPSSVSVDNLVLANPDMFIADDPSDGGGIFQGKIVKVSESDVPVPPGAPQNVSAVAGDKLAVVSWNPGTSGSAPNTGFNILILDGTGGTELLPAQQASASATSFTVTGLTNTIPYTFKVSPINTVCGLACPLSDLSNVVTPQDAVEPDAPTGLIGTAGNSAVALAWTPPLNNGGSPITGYIVRYHSTGSPIFERNIPGTATGTTISGLLNGTEYSFEVYAVNVVGDSGASNSINLTPTGAAPSVNLSLSMQGPSQVLEGEQAVYNLTVQNTGGLPVPAIRLTNTLPGAGFTAPAGISTTMGQCIALSATSIECINSALNPGQSKTVTITLNGVTQALTNSASVTGYEADGTTQITSESNALDNNASVTTTIAPPPPPPPPAEPITDLQINSGSAGNGAVNANTTVTFGLRNGAGQANHVVFTVPLHPSLSNVSATVTGAVGTCAVASGSVTCNIPFILANGQATINMVVRPTAPGSLPLPAHAGFDGFSTDTNQANNDRTVTLKVK